MASVRETLRLNTEIQEEAKILDYLGQVHDKKKSAFIREALTLYIEFIENGLCECPFIGEVKEEEVKESKFSGLITQARLGTISENPFEEIDKMYDEELDSLFK